MFKVASFTIETGKIGLPLNPKNKKRNALGMSPSSAPNTTTSFSTPFEHIVAEQRALD